MISVAGAAALALAACSSNNGGSSSSSSSSGGGSSSASGGAAGKGKIAVLLPDTKSSARWANNDLPLLTKAFEAAGLSPSQFSIVNAEGSATTQQTQAQAAISSGATVMLLTNLDSGSGAAIESNAKKNGVQAIDYDRLTLGGSAVAYVSFDNVKVGEEQGSGLVACMKQKNYTKPKIAELNGSPTDNNATLFAQGYNSVVDPLYANGTFVKGPNQSVPNWDNQQGATIFQQMLTSNPDIKGVLSANDGLGNAAISILKQQNLAGTVPVTGQDATVQGIQNVLLGYQCGSVYKPIQQEADAAAKAAVELWKGQQITEATGKVKDINTGREVPSVLQTPIWVTSANAKNTVFKDGFVTPAQVCTGAVKAKCTAAGIS